MRQALYVLAIFMIGLFLGFIVDVRGLVVTDMLIKILLYILIMLIGIYTINEISGISMVLKSLYTSMVLIITTILGSILGGIVSCIILNSLGHMKMYLAVSLGMGWYTFTGAYLLTIDRYFGLLGFMVNILREIVMFITYPILSKWIPLEAICIGGATTVDTTLPIITRFSRGGEVTFIAIIHGAILTLLIPIILSLVVWL